MNDLRLYEIMGEDHYIRAHLQKGGEVIVEVLNEDSQEVYKEKSHIYAWDSLVSFAKMVLKQDEKIQKELVICQQ